MFCTKFNSFFKSSDGIHDIAYKVYYPVGAIKGVVQIAHGMCEHFGRYDDFANFLAKNGYVVCGNDHLGHGNSVKDNSELGYFAEKDGWLCVVKDMFTLTKIMKKNYKDLPYILLGHSMGSFLARAYCTKYGRHLDGVVFSGTTGIIKGVPAMLAAVDGLKAIYGDRHRSNKLNTLVFGNYNREIEDSDSPYAWISRDKQVIEEHSKDEKGMFIFTLNGFENLAKLSWYISNEKWFETYNKSLPTMFISGDADPVGQYGEGVQEVYDKLKDYSCNVKIKLYPGARHEVLNEINKQEAYDELLAFFDNCVDGKN